MTEAEVQEITPPVKCPNCLESGTVTVITKTIGGVVRYYFQCSSCGYRWSVGSVSATA